MRTGYSVLLSILVLVGAARAGEAQTRSERDALRFTTGAGWVSLWDDETFLGRGVLISGGVIKPLARRVAVEAELAAATHHRDEGALAADGTPILGTVRLSYMFGSRDGRSRPFASVGLAALYSSGHFTTRTFVPDSRGFPVEGPAARTDWSMLRSAIELGGGVAIAAGRRVVLRPEGRWTMTGGGVNNSVLEPPVWMLRAGMTLEWRRRQSK